MTDLRSDLRAANAMLGSALAGLAALPVALDRPLIGACLSKSLAGVQDALALVAASSGAADAIGGAIDVLEQAMAALRGSAPVDQATSLILDHTARALSVLSSTRQGNGEPGDGLYERRPLRHVLPAPPTRGDEILHRWSLGGLELHRLDRPPIREDVPAQAVAQDEAEEAEPGVGEKAAVPAPVGWLHDIVVPTQAQLSAAHLEALGDLYAARMASLEDGETTAADVRELEQRLFHRVEVIAWLGGQVVGQLVERLRAADDMRAGFAAAAPLLSIEGADVVRAVCRALENLTEEAVPGVLQAMRLAPHPGIAERIPGLLSSDRRPVRAGVIWVAADRGLLMEPAISALLGDPDPEVVLTCAQAVACAARREAVPMLEGALDRSSDDLVAAEIAAAAALLGSTRALEQLREFLRRNEEPSDSAVVTIAACGDERDVGALMRIAQGTTAQAPVAIRSLGWLGSSAAFEALAMLVEKADLRASGLWALGLIAGASKIERLHSKPGRLFRGEPWSADAVVRLLRDPATTLPALRLGMRELIARMRLSVAYDHKWPLDRQQGSLATLEDALKPRMRQLPRGAWLPVGAGQLK